MKRPDMEGIYSHVCCRELRILLSFKSIMSGETFCQGMGCLVTTKIITNYCLCKILHLHISPDIPMFHSFALGSTL